MREGARSDVRRDEETCERVETRRRGVGRGRGNITRAQRTRRHRCRYNFRYNLASFSATQISDNCNCEQFLMIVDRYTGNTPAREGAGLREPAAFKTPADVSSARISNSLIIQHARMRNSESQIIISRTNF